MALRQNQILMTGIKDRVSDPRAAALINILHRSVETFIDMQQHFLTLANRQTDSMMGAAKAGRIDAGNEIAEFAREGMEQFVRSQKKFLEVIAEETAHAADASKHTGKNSEPKTDIADLARESANAFVETQKKLLDVAGRQVDLNMKTARKAMEYVGSPRVDVGDLTKEYVSNFVAAQKALLDIMVKTRAD